MATCPAGGSGVNDSHMFKINATHSVPERRGFVLERGAVLMTDQQSSNLYCIRRNVLHWSQPSLLARPTPSCSEGTGNCYLGGAGSAAVAFLNILLLSPPYARLGRGLGADTIFQVRRESSKPPFTGGGNAEKGETWLSDLINPLCKYVSPAEMLSSSSPLPYLKFTVGS